MKPGERAISIQKDGRDSGGGPRTSRSGESAPVARPPSASYTSVSELMMPQHVNNLGNVFGGVILAMVDRAAAVAAMRHAGRPCVTVSIDRVDFREPIYSGELVTCHAQVTFVGRTSLEVGVRVDAEDLLSRTVRHTNLCYLTFVAIDEHGRPIPVAPLLLESEEERQRFHEGERRREVRRALAEELGEES